MSQVSWCTSDEWKKLSRLIDSISEDVNNAPKLQVTISILNCLISRSPSPPIIARMTSELLQAFLALSRNPDTTTEEEVPVMAFAVIRFVNYVSHAFQEPGSFAVQPLHKVAAQQSVPDWLVTLRHDVSHGALPPAHLLRSALSAALHWTITTYWQDRECDGEPERPSAVTVPLRQLEAALAGPRGRHVSRSLLNTCLSSEALRRPALRTVADAMVCSAAAAKERPLPAALVQSWTSTLSAVCRCGLLTELLERLLMAVPATERCREVAALWAEQLALAVQRAAKQPEGAEPGLRGSDGGTGRLLMDAVLPDTEVDWHHLVQVVLRHKNRSTTRVLPVLLDGLSPPLSERRRLLLCQLVDIATGCGPAAHADVKVDAQRLRRLGLSLPVVAAPPVDVMSEPVDATVAPPAAATEPGWQRCADGPEWKQASEVGRLPWQRQTPALLDTLDSFGNHFS